MAENKERTRTSGAGAKKTAKTPAKEPAEKPAKKPAGSRGSQTAKAKSPATQRVAAAKDAAGKRVAAAKETAEEAVRSAGETAARVGRQAREIGETVQKRVQEDLSPLADKAGKELGKAQKKLGGFFKSTARATKKSARILGLKARVSAKVREAERLYESIGERYYQALMKGAGAQAVASELKPLVTEIDRIMAEAAALAAEEKAVRESP